MSGTVWCVCCYFVWVCLVTPQCVTASTRNTQGGCRLMIVQCEAVKGVTDRSVSQRHLQNTREHFKETHLQTTSDKANKHSHLRTITAILMAIHHFLSTHSQRQIPQLIHLHEGSQIAHIIAVIRRGEHREDLVVVIRRVSLWRTRMKANTVITAS